jgi:hypothetical protein
MRLQQTIPTLKKNREVRKLVNKIKQALTLFSQTGRIGMRTKYYDYSTRLDLTHTG